MLKLIALGALGYAGYKYYEKNIAGHEAAPAFAGGEVAPRQHSPGARSRPGCYARRAAAVGQGRPGQRPELPRQRSPGDLLKSNGPDRSTGGRGGRLARRFVARARNGYCDGASGVHSAPAGQATPVQAFPPKRCRFAGSSAPGGWAHASYRPAELGSVRTGGARSRLCRAASAQCAKIGFLSFGGPAGQIALMHRELVDERKWVEEGAVPARAQLVPPAAGPGGAAARDLDRLAAARWSRRARGGAAVRDPGRGW